MSVQYIVWLVGVVQILRFRHKARASQHDLPDPVAMLPEVPVA
jgi:hypothetical protein